MSESVVRGAQRRGLAGNRADIWATMASKARMFADEMVNKCWDLRGYLAELWQPMLFVTFSRGVFSSGYLRPMENSEDH